jgi:hypothetical protein
MFDYDKDSRDAAIVLDNYDLTEYLELCIAHQITDSWDVRDYILKESDAEIAAAIECLTMDEFMVYLSERYGVYWLDKIKYEMRFRDNIIQKK